MNKLANDVNINVDSPEVQAPVSVNFGSLFDGFRSNMDKFVSDVRSGSDEVLTGIFLAGMFVVAGLYLWRQV